MYKMLESVKKDTKWLPWKFSRVPSNFWDDMKNRREYILWLEHQLNIKSPDEWYRVTTNTVRQNCGSGLLSKYHNSVYLLLKALYPDQNWLPWRFEKTPNKFWKDPIHRKEYLDYIKGELGINKPEDWYEVSTNEIHKRNGKGLLNIYNNSLHLLLKDNIPEYEWEQWKFKFLPQRTWDSSDNIKGFIKYIEQSLKIKNIDEWYRISTIQLNKFGAQGLLKKYGSIYSILCIVYPDQNWDDKSLKRRNKKAAQRWLKLCLEEIFPTVDILEDYRLSNENVSVEVDIWLPKLNLAFEYQGEHHYVNIPSISATTENYKKKDDFKKSFCASINVTLIEIPYWWDGEMSSVLPYIKSTRPELLVSHHPQQ
eukprot:TRINITY_DN924_c0_g1_i3.p1 TRINITY_DN924_c0_g1~~TRINITY_DN924_c0_g1_i3.p1  ORF type:complete len:367 (-),score=32.65 TRINITY_DN924_c0_g1_i3:25-1125(-)